MARRVPDRRGLNPLRCSEPIPLWFGGQADEVLRRTARLGDGWMPNYRQVEARLARRWICCGAAWRNTAATRGALAWSPRLNYSTGGPGGWMAMIQAWRAVGATRFVSEHDGLRYSTPAAHLEALWKFAQVCTIG